MEHWIRNGEEVPKGREKVLKFNRPQAGGFLGLTGPWGPKVVVAADAAVKKRAPVGAGTLRVQRVQRGGKRF